MAVLLSLSGPWVAYGQVTASGQRSVAIGTITGDSTINVGLTPKEAKELAKATGQQLVKQLAAIVERINGQKGAKANAQAVSLGVVQGFLATVKGKQVPPEEWPQTFGELTRQYLILGERIQATPVTSDRIKGLMVKADAARKLGQLKQADQLLATAEELAIDDALKKQEQAKTSTRQAASISASRASVAFNRLERVQGALLLEKAFDLRWLDPSSDTFWWLVEAGKAWTVTGQNDEALRCFVKARTLALAQTASDSGNVEWQRNLSISHTLTGYVQQAQSDPSAALKSFQESLGISQKLVASDKGNIEWQRNLSISHTMIGYVQQAQGNPIAALKSVQAGMEVAQKLVASDSGNVDWQQHLAASHGAIGNLQKAKGDLVGALKSYQASLGISQKLAASDARNADWQLSVSSSLRWIGDVQRAQNDPGAALRSYKASMEISQRLADSDPGNTMWQQNLLSDHNQIGITQQARGDLDAALRSHQASMGIAQKLVASNPANTMWQQNLWFSHNWIGDVQRAQDNLGAALTSYKAGMEIAQKLADSDQNNAQWQLNVAMACLKIYSTTAATAVDERKQVLTKGLEVLKALEAAEKLPDTAKGWPAFFSKTLAELG